MNRDPDALCEFCGEQLGLGVTRCWSCTMPLPAESSRPSGKEERLLQGASDSLRRLHRLLQVLHARALELDPPTADPLCPGGSGDRLYWKAWWWMKGLRWGIVRLRGDLEEAFLCPSNNNDGRSRENGGGERRAGAPASELAAWLEQYRFAGYIVEECGEEPLGSLRDLKARLVLWLRGGKGAVGRLLKEDPRWRASGQRAG